ncbi:MAG: hypothetical protein ACI8RZ_004375 [Myxococcota bacterium]|jgi:hypothetical protein
MHEDRILELIRQRRDHQRSRLRSFERRGLFVIALVAAVGVGICMLVGGSMSEVWGSMLLSGLFVIVTGLLLAALLFAGATVFPLDGRHLFHSGRSERAVGWDRWLTDKGFEGRPLADFRSLLPEAPKPEVSPEADEDEGASEEITAEEGTDGEESAEAEPAVFVQPPPPPMTEAEKITYTRQRLSDFLAETVLDGQNLDLSVDPLLRAEVMDYWSIWFIAERSAGLLRRAFTMALLALVLGGLTSIQLSEEIASSTQSSRGGADGGKSGKSGKSGKGGGGPDSEGGKSGKGGGLDSEGGKSGKGGKGGGLEGGLEGGKSGKGGKGGNQEGGGEPEPGSKAGKAGGQDGDAPSGGPGSGGSL